MAAQVRAVSIRSYLLIIVRHPSGGTADSPVRGFGLEPLVNQHPTGALFRNRER